MAYGTATLTGTYKTFDGQPAEGVVEIIPNSRQLIDAAGDAILAGRVKVTLAGGAFTVTLPATDDTSVEPATGRQYTVVAKLRHTHLPAITGIELPTGSTVDVADRASAPVVDPAVSLAATTTQLAAVEADVAALSHPGNHDGQSQAINIPAPTGDTEMLLDTAGVAVDGVKFFTIIKATGRITTPLDAFYAYVGGHDGDDIWLATAPTPTGPWTYQQSVYTTAAATYLTDHVSSPHAIWWDGQMILYVHGIAGSAQPTVALTSTDGVTFTEQAAIAFPAPGPDEYPLRHDAASTSYVRVVDAGGFLAAVYQANNVTTMDDPVGEIATSVGFATSTDGLTWRMSPVPLIANPPGERGPYGPGLFRVNGMWVLSAFEPSRAVVSLWVADRLEPGRFRRYGEWFAAPGGGFDWVDCPVTFWDDGTMHLYYGATDSTYTVKGRIRHAVIDWSL